MNHIQIIEQVYSALSAKIAQGKPLRQIDYSGSRIEIQDYQLTSRYRGQKAYPKERWQRPTRSYHRLQ